MCIPHFLKSQKTFVGFTLFGGYVNSEEQITITRFAFISLCPFIIISMLFPLVLALIGWLTPTLKFLIILNAVSSSMDVLNLILILLHTIKLYN
nr:metalloprotease family protein [Halobacillus sp. BBL2006]